MIKFPTKLKIAYWWIYYFIKWKLGMPIYMAKIYAWYEHLYFMAELDATIDEYEWKIWKPPKDMKIIIEPEFFKWVDNTNPKKSRKPYK